MWVEGRWDNNAEPYDHLLGLSYPGWSWEYKRRDPELIEAARRARRHAPTILKRPDGASLTRLKRRFNEAERFGLHYIPDPNLSALSATPFWLPEVMTSGLHAISELEIEMGRRERAPIRWDQLPGEKHFLLAPGRRPKLVIAAPGYAAQLAIEENALPVPRAVYLSLRLGAGELLGDNLDHVRTFADACGGDFHPFAPLRGHDPETLRRTIIALDGHLAGASYRRIAAAIFGEEMVRTDDQRGSRSFTSRADRLVKKGLKLMKTGYLDLL